MSKPTTIRAEEVWGEEWKQVQFENRRTSIYTTGLGNECYYHVWAVDTSACNFFIWTRRNRNLIHLGGPEASIHLLRFRLNGQSYIGEHDFNTVSNLAKCPADADDRILFKLAVAFAKRKIEGKEEGSR